MADFRHYCAACALRPACEHTFGAFFADKSANGTGCNHPIAPFDVARVMRCAATVRPSDVAAATAASAFSQPRQTADGKYHKWIVSHDGRNLQTAARSEREAINNIRFKLYATTPLDQLPPFSARRATDAEERNETKAAPDRNALMARLLRMRGGAH